MVLMLAAVALLQVARVQAAARFPQHAAPLGRRRALELGLGIC
jgi:hypothetical protein